MSFWDGLAKAGGAIMEQMNEKQAKINRYKEMYCGLDDRALIRKYKSATGDAKYACAILLRERGYGSKTNT